MTALADMLIALLGPSGRDEAFDICRKIQRALDAGGIVNPGLRLRSSVTLGRISLARDEPAEAIRLLEAAIDDIRSWAGPDPALCHLAEGSLATAYAAAG